MTREPAVIIGAIVSVVVTIASIFHIVINPDTATGIITAIAPLVSGLLIRFHVTPAPSSNA